MHALSDICSCTGEQGAAVYIIDPAFREQFDLAHATPRYQQILDAIPATFVGTEERLVALVRALCQEIQSVFSEQNTTLPPGGMWPPSCPSGAHGTPWTVRSRTQRTASPAPVHGPATTSSWSGL